MDFLLCHVENFLGTLLAFSLTFSLTFVGLTYEIISAALRAFSLAFASFAREILFTIPPVHIFIMPTDISLSPGRVKMFTSSRRIWSPLVVILAAFIVISYLITRSDTPILEKIPPLLAGVFDGIALIMEKITPLLAGIFNGVTLILKTVFEGLSGPAAGILTFTIVTASLLVPVTTSTRLLTVIPAVFIAIPFLLAQSSTSILEKITLLLAGISDGIALIMEKIMPLLAGVFDGITLILKTVFEGFSGTAAGILTFTIVTASLLIPVTTSTRLLTVVPAVFIAIPFLLAQASTSILEKITLLLAGISDGIALIMEKITPLLAGISDGTALIMEKITPLLAGVFDGITLILKTLFEGFSGPAAGILTFTITTASLLVPAATSTKILIFLMFLMFLMVQSPNSTLEVLDKLGPILEALIQRNAFPQLLAFIAVIVIFRRFF
ncbi:hypothetical protein B0T25DRAFT_563414 [Lasiosphaeria hispida]|uniref:Uncharacterized protein n=1 Tax=Lasiosphaeria hispida TaxID=260671 RepID=A0AAJ0HWW8_9PEZI|nr:hypothetical protein B0T25DRAFT_563414 [Lasiosphaeria hispida]